MPSPPCIIKLNVNVKKWVFPMNKKFLRARARGRAKIMEIVATDFANGTSPHPKLLEYVLGRNKEMPKLASTKPKKKPKDNFYQSAAWRRLRYDTLRKYGARCQVCGSTDRIEVDHIHPRSKYPKLALDPNNVQVTCHKCNQGKSNRWNDDWR